ncbi:MAG: metallophosphoesterase [Deltaproteobacteria bacterium]|nr:metallophosphoesterase [Deltaproteobacteria bacterium]
MIAYLTDVEGRWDKLMSFVDGNPLVWLEGGRLRLADGATFVFGGDAVDRGAHARRIVDLLLAAKRVYGERVVLIAGNRDINKLRLVRELGGAPPPKAPTGTTRGELFRWILAHTMGAPKAFGHRAGELSATGEPADDDAVVDSYLADLAPGGPLRAYLEACCLGYRHGATLFLHGGVTDDNFGVVPNLGARLADVDAWLAALDRFYRDELATFALGGDPAELIAYQRARPGMRDNPFSVVYARPTDADLNPHLPGEDVVARLRRGGIGRVVVGHTPSGDCPAVVRDGDFELVLADNSYGRIELGSQVAISDGELRIRATTELDDGTRAAVDFATARGDRDAPLGRRDATTGRLVKARLDAATYLLFRGLPQYRVEQVAAPAAEVTGYPLVVAR